MDVAERTNKHLNLQERYDIEDGLNKGYTVSVIARKLGRDRSTVAKEIKRHRIGDEASGQRSNDCMYRQYCQKKALCSAEIRCVRLMCAMGVIVHTNAGSPISTIGQM